MKTSETITEINKALIEAQTELKNIKETKNENTIDKCNGSEVFKIFHDNYSYFA